jgi:hypothetical protein
LENCVYHYLFRFGLRLEGFHILCPKKAQTAILNFSSSLTANFLNPIQIKGNGLIFKLCKKIKEVFGQTSVGSNRTRTNLCSKNRETIYIQRFSLVTSEWLRDIMDIGKNQN